MSSNPSRVQFRAPDELVERANILATALETEREDILATALREYLDDAVCDDEIEQEIAAAYYDAAITDEQLASLVGRAQATNFRALKRQLKPSYVDEIADL
ncbi:hypothetical protein [Natronorubrum tibetense]|uniref:Ribbon-helix-helix protein CopG domain-containing protein n=1 Tax=Natronorubrum tibetense GA33 TaxID=1114856 RepID=L9W0B6_9EURY|nr:hypothetical protein [Natronorubrum tibetense]ELY42895.1 hypothetical protein C496_06162 [Natronorubrum tibetense GA33]